MYRVEATSVRPVERADISEQAESVIISTNTYAVNMSFVYTCAISAEVSSSSMT